MTRRDEQREATRRHIVTVAADVLTREGPAGTTTLAVQKEAGLSRGALLHHFPAREELLAAAIASLRTSNRAAVREALEHADADSDPVDRAVHALVAAVVRPEFSAELGLWAAARADEPLRRALQREERGAREELYAVLDEAFGPELCAHPSYPRLAALTVQLLRGLAITQTLRVDRDRNESLVRDWSSVLRSAFATDLLSTPESQHTERE